MSEAFKFSDPGEGLEEAEVLEIHVGEGDQVNDGDIVLTVETDKAATDIPAPFTGKVERIHVKTGDTVRVDDLLISYNPDGSEDAGSGKQDKEEAQPDASDGDDSAKSADADKGKNQDRQQQASSAEPEDEKGAAQPRADASDEEDEENAEEGDTRREAPSDDSQSEDSQHQADKRAPVPAAPSTRRIARERGVDLHAIDPSGPHGRVTTEDVEAAARHAESTGGTAEQTDQQRGPQREATALPDFSRWGETERQPMRSIRRATAKRMAQSWREIPHVYHQDVADVTELERFRHDYETSAEAAGGKFTMTLLMLKAMVYALKQFPRFNASLDTANEEIVLKRYCNIGVAVATDQGLLVPVVRDVDRKNLIELTAELNDIVDKARAGELARQDMEGASMTLTNPGPLGGTALTPLINPPEVAILGMGQARLEPVVHGDLSEYQIKPRLMLPLSLGFDHRVNDGADAAKFVSTLIGALEDPHSLLLKI
ncbi:MAG: dihydrolipoamide acetyltransferase family protein [Pseudomonadota bacterium]|nr:dihydrolipoamide acetyltransferase family protein [Pseudomonadota bacterium]